MSSTRARGRTIDPWFLDGTPASRTRSVVVTHLERAGKRLYRGGVSGEGLVILMEGGVDLDFAGMGDTAMLSAVSAIVVGFERRLDGQP